MTPKQRYLFDVTGYLHLKSVLNPQELKHAQDAADRYIRTPPEKWEPGFGANLERPDFTPYSHGFAFDKALESLCFHPVTWPIIKELTGDKPRFTSGSLGTKYPWATIPSAALCAGRGRRTRNAPLFLPRWTDLL